MPVDRSVPAFFPEVKTGNPPPMALPPVKPKETVVGAALREAKALRPGQWFLLPRLSPDGQPPNRKRNAAVVTAFNGRARRGAVKAAAALTTQEDQQRVVVVHADTPGDYTTASKSRPARAVVVKSTPGGVTP